MIDLTTIKDKSGKEKRGKPTVVDLFCGAGGLSLGFEQAGFEILAGVDLFASAMETFQTTFPEALAISQDITNLSPEELLNHIGAPPDVLVGGPSCQGFSTSGGLSRANGRNQFDPRNSLFREYVRFAEVLQPKFLVLENVPGLLLYNKGAVAREIIEILSEAGFSAAPMILLAADYGVPQLRRRLIIVAERGERSDVPFPMPTHSADGLWEGFSLPFAHLSRLGHGRGNTDLQQHITLSEALSDLPSIEAGGGDPCSKYISAPTSSFQKGIRSRAATVTQHESFRLSEAHLDIVRSVRPGENWTSVPQELLPPRFEKMRPYDATTLMKRLVWEKPAYTITTKFNEISTGAFIHPRDDRTLSIREAARLQSFPDRVSFSGTATQIRRQIGNAVPPLLGKAIAMAIRGALLGNEDEKLTFHAETGVDTINLKADNKDKSRNIEQAVLPV